MKNEQITSRDIDFAKWYTDVVRIARLAAYSKTKGCIIIEPNGYAIWEEMQKVLDRKFKELGHQNVSLPMLIPESLMNKESELINGFAPEVAWVTQGGNKSLEERLCIRPTSETLFSDYYSTIVKTYRDLPILYNQWCNVLRWEKETRPFLRSREFLWQEGHTLHKTSGEAEAETKQMLEVYKNFFEDYLAIPVITGKKTEAEKFAGAEYTTTVEALMYNGVSLQSATSHYFGQKFSKAYDIKFMDEKNNLSYPYQTSWGTTTRMIGALIMVHSDDNGLVLPPKIAPRKIVVIPIGTDEKVNDQAKEITKKLNDAGITSYLDDSAKSPGFRFAQAEVNGIPLRIEIGPKDLENNTYVTVRRDTYQKKAYNLNGDIVTDLKALLDQMQQEMFDKALQRNKSKTYEVNDLNEFKKIMHNTPGFIKAYWCGDHECELKIKEIDGTKSRCILEKDTNHQCIVCGKKSQNLVLWGIQY